MAKFCGNCGSSLSDEEKFCGSCGAPVEQTPEPVASQEVVPEPVPVQAVNVQAQQAGTYVQPEQPQNAGTYTQQVSSDSAAFNDGGATVAKPMGKKPVMLAAIAAIVVVVVIAAVIVIMQLTKYQKIDAKDLFNVSFTGPDGYGSGSAMLNVDPQLIDDSDMRDSYYEWIYSMYSFTDSEDEPKYSDYLIDSRKKTEKAYSKASDYSEAKDMRDALLETKKNKDGDKEFAIKATLSKTDGLKNGDKVTVTVEYDEEELKENKIKLENTEFEVEVKGLAAAEVIDPFAGVEVTFTGKDSMGDVSVDYSSAKYGNFVYFNYDYVYDLSNGDIFTLTASCYEYLEPIDEEDASKGYWFEYEDKYYIWESAEEIVTKEYTVEGLTELTEVDPFDGMVVNYEYGSPFLRIESISAPEGDIGDVLSDNGYYTVVDSEYDTRYKIGDTITIEYHAYSWLADDGYKVKGANDDNTASTQYTIEATAPVYANAENAADAVASLSATVDAKVQDMRQDLQGTSYVSGVDLDDSIESIKSFELLDSYLQVNNATDYANIGWSEEVSIIVNLYKVTVELDNGDKVSFYATIKCSDPLGVDGVFTCNSYMEYEYYEKKDDAIKEIENLEGYTVSVIGEAAAESTESAADSSSEEIVP